MFQECNDLLKVAVWLKLYERQLQYQQKLSSVIQQREALTTSMMNGRLWQSAKEIDRKLSLFTEDSTKWQALKRQLQCREKVLQQPPLDGRNAKFYCVTANRIPFSVNELCDQLLQLASAAASFEQFLDLGSLDGSSNIDLLTLTRS